MKICIVIPSLTGGGAEFVAREWANWLADRGHEITLAITNSIDEGFVRDGVTVIRLRGVGAAGHVISLRRLVHRQRIDAVIGLLPYYNFLAVLSTISQRHRPICLVSGRNVEVPFPEVHGRKVRIMRALSRILYPMADGFIAISHPVAAEAGALYKISPEKIVVVPNPATGKAGDLLKARLTLWNHEDRNERETATGAIKLIIPARLSAQKRPELVLKVARRLNELNHPVELHFYGDGPLRKKIEELAAQYGVAVTVHGWVEDWFELAPDHGIVFLPSIVEGFGNVFVEAACAGLPSVVSSRALGVADAVVPNITGQIVAFDEVDKYVQAVLDARVMTVDPKAVARWTERFSVESSGGHLEHFLTSIHSTSVSKG